MSLCTLVTHFKVVGHNTTELWKLYVFTLFSNFGIEKYSFSKNIYLKSYFITRLY